MAAYFVAYTRSSSFSVITLKNF